MGKQLYSSILYFIYDELSFAWTIHNKTTIASKISGKVLSKIDAQVSFLSLFLNSVKFCEKLNSLNWALS